MFERDIWVEVAQVLYAKPLRTVLTAAGIFWGIFILIIMLGFGNGIEDGVKKTMAGYATNANYIWTEVTTVPYKGHVPGRYIELVNSDTAAIAAQVPSIDVLSPRLESNGRIDVTYDLKSIEAEVSGDYPQYRRILPMSLLYGRYINKLDILDRRRVAVIGERIHTELFGNKTNPVGKKIQIEGLSYTIVGVYRPENYGTEREEMERSVFIPFTTYQETFSTGPTVSYYAIIPMPGHSAASVGDKVIDLIRKRHQISPKDEPAIGSWNTEEEYNKITLLFSGVNVFIWIVGLATLLAGVLGVSNMMIISIRERRRELGIRKSVGATPATVIRMVLLETSSIVTISGLLGLGAGLVALYFIDILTATTDEDTSVLFSTPTVDPAVALGSVLVLVLASCLASVLPAINAMKIDPVEALRPDS